MIRRPLSARTRPRSPAFFVVCVSTLTLSSLGSEPAAHDATPRRMQLPASINRVIEQRIPVNPSEYDLRNFQGLPEPLVPVSAVQDEKARRALAAALNDWKARKKNDDHSALRHFVGAHPTSRWTPSLQLNLGILSYSGGYFSLALSDWSGAWEGAKDIPTVEGTTVANAAVAQYVRMLARVGRKRELSVILEAVKNREFQGKARANYVAAREGYAQMVTGPDRAYRCGPFALASVKEHLTGKLDLSLLHDIPSPEGGFNLVQVSEMAAAADLKMTAARRSVGAPVITPSVVHFKLNHYGALLEEKNGLYRLKDPTFGSEQWVSKDAIDHESSGAFLIVTPAAGLPRGWQQMEQVEMASIYGKGKTDCVDDSGGAGNGPKKAPPPSPTPACPGGPSGPSAGMPGGGGAGSVGGCGMAAYRFLQIPCGLIIQDSPIAYQPAFGPYMNFRVSYNQREADRGDSLLFSNFGPLWSGEFVGYLEDNGNNIVIVHLRNGGYVRLSLLTSNKDIAGSSTVVQVSSNVYERRFGDGSKEVYGLATGPAGSIRNLLLTQIVDAKGLALTFVYDDDPSYPTRLKHLVDASGLSTDLFYEMADKPYLISRVRDPFGREAHFLYADVAGRRRLETIRDMIGLESSFGYDRNGVITSMTTPYGTTKFDYADAASDPTDISQIRFLEATDPLGAKERIEFHASDNTYGVSTEPQVPTADGLGFDNSFLFARNVFSWDRKAMQILGGSVSANRSASLANATIFHYLHSGNAASGVLESVKRPLQSRLYYHYPNQGSDIYIGTATSTTWSSSARLVEDGQGGVATELYRRELNDQDKMTRMIDPVGRETTYEYDTNGIDLRFTKQKVNGDYQTIQEIQYNPSFPPHLPWKVIDAAGQPTTYAYNDHGQVISITNALNETTTFTYEDTATAPDFGKVKMITGALPGATTTFTYDSAQRVRTITDSAGYTLTYDYDDMDRLTRTTYPDGTYDENTYDRLEVGNRRDRMGRITQFKYNPRREMVLSIDPAQRVLQYEYCNCGSMETLIDGNGNPTIWDYDVQGRQISKRYADGKGDDFAYEPMSGRLSTITDAKRQIKKFTYNLDGTLKRLDYQNAAIATSTVSYTYDSDFNRIATMVDGVGTSTYSYYPIAVLGALKLNTLDGPSTDPEPLTDLITYTYDELGRVKTRNIGPNGDETRSHGDTMLLVERFRR
jgi:YD repeat-containing protein